MILPDRVDSPVRVPEQRAVERRAVPAPRAVSTPRAVPAQDRRSRPAWSLRTIFRNHPFPAVPGSLTTSLCQDEEATR